MQPGDVAQEAKTDQRRVTGVSGTRQLEAGQSWMDRSAGFPQDVLERMFLFSKLPRSVLH